MTVGGADGADRDDAGQALGLDNDPLVLVHARALLTSTPPGVTAYIDADVHRPRGSSTARPGRWHYGGVARKP